MEDAAWQVKFSAYKAAAETQIATLRAEVERLRKYANEVITRSESRFPREVAQHYGLLDERGEVRR